MKKIFMTLVAAMFTVCASAQVYVGGNVGIASVDNGHDDDVTVYSLLPEVGYKFNDNWAAGVMFGWSKGSLSQWRYVRMVKGKPLTIQRKPKLCWDDPYIRS